MPRQGREGLREAYREDSRLADDATLCIINGLQRITMDMMHWEHLAKIRPDEHPANTLWNSVAHRDWK